MKVSVKTGDPRQAECEILAVPLFEHDPAKWRLPQRIAALDQALGAPIAAALRSGDFRGRPGESLLLYPSEGSGPKRVLLLGLGPEAKVDGDALRRAAGAAVTRGAEKRVRAVALAVPSLRRVRPPDSAQALAEGAVLGAYRSDAYRSDPGEEAPRPVDSLALLYEKLPERAKARAAAGRGSALAESQNLARRLSNLPANELPPAALAREAEKVAREAGLRCQVMEPAELRRRKMGGILAVGAGSHNPPRLIVLEHNAPRGGRKKAGRGGRSRPTVCVVGKGITFDSGGISIKPSEGMQDMKHDMSGAAAAVGALRAAALLKLPLHVVGVIAAAENMPSGTAYRPGDVVRTASGKTIEILNTDAEGRVVLADALHHAISEYRPQAVVDLATLTGACVIALGPWATGMFGNDQRMIERVRKAGEAVGERVWPLPLFDEHREAMKSQVADLKNAGGRQAGACTAAGFLSSFVGETPWVHLDIAGTAWTDKAGPTQPVGATGVGVRLVFELLRGWKAGRAV
jgi:leucyl aminopeptidase